MARNLLTDEEYESSVILFTKASAQQRAHRKAHDGYESCLSSNTTKDASLEIQNTVFRRKAAKEYNMTLFSHNSLVISSD